jgi:sugar phosphate isomerase/epimerase
VGVLWDTHHPWRFCGESFANTYRQIGRWVRHVHWKDSVHRDRHETSAEATAAAQQAEALMSGHRHADYVMFGTGEFPARECLASLVAGGYDGWHCLEWEKMWHPELEEPETALPPFPREFRALHSSVCAEVTGNATRSK